MGLTYLFNEDSKALHCAVISDHKQLNQRAYLRCSVEGKIKKRDNRYKEARILTYPSRHWRKRDEGEKKSVSPVNYTK